MLGLFFLNRGFAFPIKYQPAKITTTRLRKRLSHFDHGIGWFSVENDSRIESSSGPLRVRTSSKVASVEKESLWVLISTGGRVILSVL